MNVGTDPLFDPAAIERFGIESGVVDVMNTAWGWPIVEIFHFTGLCMLFGTIGMFDLAMMGVVKGISLKGLHRLVPIGVAGFCINVASGLMFVIATPFEYLYNPALQTKFALILLAGLNMVLFYATTARAIHALGPADPVPLRARYFAIASLVFWLGVVACGRVITAFRPPFHWCLWCG